jgi:hypothetical protein
MMLKYYQFSKMKPLYALLFLILLSCGTKNSATENAYTPTKDTVTAQPRQPFSIPFYAKTDNVRLLPNEDNFIYDKAYFDAVVDNFPILYTDSTLSYYESYQKSGMKKRYKDSLGNTNTIDFSSEMGLDEYAVFYAYFLKRFNTSAEANIRRKKTSAILSAMNAIQEVLNCGGTMYHHEYTRLIAQTEYEVYN